MIEKDSLLDLKTGIVIEHINEIRPNCRMVFFDACFNGDFRNDDYIAGKFIFSEGKTGCMVYISQDGYVSPLYLKDLQNAEGKIPPRLVDINSDKIQQIINNVMHYITPADYEAAKAYVANPEAYDFTKILEW